MVISIIEEILHIEDVIKCNIVRRVNRFVIEVEINSKKSLASINNTGRLEEFLTINSRGYCIERKNSGKTRYRLIAIDDLESGALIDTDLQMRSFEILLDKSRIPWLKGYSILKRNPRLEKSILDYLLEKDNQGDKMFLEIKSAVLRDGDAALYPDCISVRGRRHIRELIGLSRYGEKAAMVFIVGLNGVKLFKPNSKVDPEIERLLRIALNYNVKVKAISLYYDHNKRSIMLSNPDLPVLL